MEQFRSLKGLTSDELYMAFQDAFADYEMQLNQAQLEAMLKRRGFRPELSFGAFDGDKLVSFTFNGIGHYNDLPTAYDTGTGTTKEYRRKGLAKKIFEYSIPFLKKAGIEQYILEVLQHNESAVDLYKKTGFEVLREYEYFVFEKSAVSINPSSMNESFMLQENFDLLEVDRKKFWDFHPSWQNSFDSVARQPEAFRSLGIYREGELIAYSIFEPTNGDITQFAVHKDFRRKGLATILFKEMLDRMDPEELKIINTVLSSEPIEGFLKALNLHSTGKQYEMIRRFNSFNLMSGFLPLWI